MTNTHTVFCRAVFAGIVSVAVPTATVPNSTDRSSRQSVLLARARGREV